MKIATSYPNILKKYLRSQNIKAVIHEINGSVEIAPGIGMADAIFDIVSTGSTLVSNGLVEVEVILNSEAVLVARPGLNGPKRKILDQLLFRINAVQAANSNKYILLNAPDAAIPRIIQLLPGMRSPTVVPLAQQGWSSLHSVVKEDDFWEVIENLREAGAEGILVIPIEKMIELSPRKYLQKEDVIQIATLDMRKHREITQYYDTVDLNNAQQYNAYLRQLAFHNLSCLIKAIMLYLGISTFSKQDFKTNYMEGLTVALP